MFNFSVFEWKISELENFKQMQYVRRFVFKAPKLNVMNAEENLQYEGYARECVCSLCGIT